jgi:hypothetical protein
MNRRKLFPALLCFLVAGHFSIHAFGQSKPIVIDNPAATFEGAWERGTTSEGKYGEDYEYSFTVAGVLTATGTYRPTITKAGKYDVEIFFPTRITRTSDASWAIFYNGGSMTSRVDQAVAGGSWIRIGAGLDFAEGTNGHVVVSNDASDAGAKENGKSHVVADAVRFVPLFAAANRMETGPGIFSADFDSGLPPHTQLYGDAKVENEVLQLTAAQRDQMGTLVIDSWDDNKPIKSFVATFRMLIGGGSGADGLGFFCADDLPKRAVMGSGIKNGLMLFWDTYKNEKEAAPGLGVFLNQNLLAEVSIPDLRSHTFVDVQVKFDPDGSLDVIWNGQMLFTNLATHANGITGRFGFFARTGHVTDNHLIDDVHIRTTTVAGPFIESFKPTGADASPDASVEIFLSDFVTQVNTKSIQLQLDGAVVTPEIMKQGASTRITFQSFPLLEPGSSHTASLTFSDNSKVPMTNSFSFPFTISENVGLSK